MESGYEKEYTTINYWDGPREGIADFEGQPHLYKSEWDDKADDYAETFVLSPVDKDIFLLAIEDEEIIRRWWVAFYEGQAPEGTRPALPEDRQRHDELQRILKQRLIIDPQNCIRAYGDFRRACDPTWSGKIFPPQEVRWTRA